MKENLMLTVFMHLTADEDKVKDLADALKTKAFVKEVILTSKEDAAKAMEAELGQDFISTLGYNPLGATLDVRFDASANTQIEMAKMKSELAENPLVREVIYKASEIEQIQANTERLLVILGTLTGLFLIISITLINSTIRLDLYSSRFLIRSMQLVGATKWFIVKPFILKSIKGGIWGVILALMLLSGLAYFFYLLIPDLVNYYHWLDLIIVLGVLLSGGILLTAICSYFATSKYLRMKLEELY